jgi:hypothetical protein
MPSALEKNATYVSHHYVRKFLRQHARPSVCEELLEAIDESDTALSAMVRGVYRDLTGKECE